MSGGHAEKSCTSCIACCIQTSHVIYEKTFLSNLRQKPKIDNIPTIFSTRREAQLYNVVAWKEIKGNNSLLVFFLPYLQIMFNFAHIFSPFHFDFARKKIKNSRKEEVEISEQS